MSERKPARARHSPLSRTTVRTSFTSRCACKSQPIATSSRIRNKGHLTTLCASTRGCGLETQRTELMKRYKEEGSAILLALIVILITCILVGVATTLTGGVTKLTHASRDYTKLR